MRTELSCFQGLPQLDPVNEIGQHLTSSTQSKTKDEKALRERHKHCARAGCSKVRTPPARCHKPTDRTDYNTLRRS